MKVSVLLPTRMVVLPRRMYACVLDQDCSTTRARRSDNANGDQTPEYCAVLRRLPIDVIRSEAHFRCENWNRALPPRPATIYS